MERNPLVTCIALTYNRHEMLNELVNCFINQTYVNKELIIINDEELVTYVCSIPNIKIINCKKRFNSLGEKREYSRRFVNGKFIFFLDDDDIYYSNHIEEMVNNYKDGYDCVKLDNTHMSTHNESIEIIQNICFASMLFTKNYVMNKKFNIDLNVGEDVDYIKGANILRVNNEIITYNYRWGNNTKHISGYGDDPNSWENCKIVNNRDITKVISGEFNEKTKLYYK